MSYQWGSTQIRSCHFIFACLWYFCWFLETIAHALFCCILILKIIQKQVKVHFVIISVRWPKSFCERKLCCFKYLIPIIIQSCIKIECHFITSLNYYRFDLCVRIQLFYVLLLSVIFNTAIYIYDICRDIGIHRLSLFDVSLCLCAFYFICCFIYKVVCILIWIDLAFVFMKEPFITIPYRLSSCWKLYSDI